MMRRAKKRWKRVTAIAVAVLMVGNTIDMSVFAASVEESPYTVVSEEYAETENAEVINETTDEEAEEVTNETTDEEAEEVTNETMDEEAEEVTNETIDEEAEEITSEVMDEETDVILEEVVDDGAGAVSYVEYTWNESTGSVVSEQKSVEEYTEVTSTTTTWKSGWYVVSSDVTVSRQITVSGTVHLILVDNCTLTASKGVLVEEGNIVCIYAQSSDKDIMGKIVANGEYLCAGIGGGSSGNGGSVTINGGTVTATGDEKGAGIGGCQYESEGIFFTGANVIITGGNVKASGYTPIETGDEGEASGSLEDGSGNNVYLNTITLCGVTESLNVSSVIGVTDYGLTDVATLDNNVLYFYLSEASTMTSVIADGKKYTGVLTGSTAKSGTFHNWTYSKGTDNTIIAKCHTSGCENGNVTVEVAPPDSTIYTGEPVEAKAAVTPENALPISVTYEAVNGSLTEGKPVNAGTYKASITLSDCTISTTYDITKKTPEASDFNFAVSEDLRYDGTAKEAELTAKHTGMGEITVSYYYSEDDVISEEAVDDIPTDAGTYKVKISVTEGENYNEITELTDDSWIFTIAKADLKADYFLFEAPENLIYDGNPKEAKITSADGITGLGNITISYYSVNEEKVESLVDGIPTNTGTYKVKISVTEGKNCNEITDLTGDSWTFTISKSIPVFNETDFPMISGTYGQTLAEMELSKTADTSSNHITGTWSITETDKDNVYPTVGTQEAYEITFTPDKTEAYESYATTVVPNVDKKKLTVKKVTAADREYIPDTKTVDIKIELEGVIEGDDVGLDNAEQLQGTVSSANAGAYTSVILPELKLEGDDSGNYELVQPVGEVAADVAITPLKVTVKSVTATDREYIPDIKTVDIRIELEGIRQGDKVVLENEDKLQGILSSANAGTYHSVTLPELKLEGDDSGNYELIQPTGEVAVNVTIIPLNTEIKIEKITYDKIYGDEDFYLEGITKTGDGTLVYTLSEGKDVEGQPKAEQKIITVSEEGKVTIHGTGCVTIIVSMEATNNYKAAEPKQITVNVARRNGFYILELPEVTYTGKAIKLEPEVYDGNTEQKLEKGKDYTLSYKNNTNAYTLQEDEDGFDEKKAPQIIIKGKGNYSEKLTVYYTIQPKDISDLTDESITAEDIILEQNGKQQKKVPVITYNKKKLSGVTKPEDGQALKKTKDFLYSYPELEAEETKSTAFKENGTYQIFVEGTGNYTGTRVVNLTITEKGTNLAKATVSKLPDKTYNSGVPIELTEEELVVTAKVNGVKNKLVKGTHYEVSYRNNTEIGTATVIITGKAGSGYAGTKTATFKIIGTSLARAEVSGLTDEIYNAEAQKQILTLSLPVQDGAADGADDSIVNGKIVLKEGTDFEVIYDKNVNVGTARLTINGIGAYTGTIKKTFKIIAYDLTGETDTDGKCKENSLLSEANGLLEKKDGELLLKYVKGGSKPEVQLSLNGKELTAGTDYTITYSNNKAVTTEALIAARKAPTITIKGKGNFKGSFTKTFTITAKYLKDKESPVTMTAVDKAVSAKAGGYISKPVLTDADGKVLKAGKDYDTPVYTTTDENGNMIILGSADKVEAGKVITVTVTGLGAYAGEAADTDGTPSTEAALSTSYRITGQNFGNVKVTGIQKAYTGKEVTLTPEDFKNEDGTSKITIKIGKESKELVYGTDFEIVEGSYKNNIKKGTASVTLKGLGEYGGTKTIKFKVGTRGLFWWWNK